MNNSHMHDVGTTMAATSIATMSRTNSPQAMVHSLGSSGGPKGTSKQERFMIVEAWKHSVKLHLSYTGSICADTAVVPRAPQIKVSSVSRRGQGAAGRGKDGSGRGQYGFYKGQCGFCRGQCGADRGGKGGTGRGQVGIGRGLRRKIANARGTPFESENASYSQVPPLPINKRPYSATSFLGATGCKRIFGFVLEYCGFDLNLDELDLNA
ncbi:hypothetical protein FXO38_12295 [Capsicum annuum]|nr:hypothetical protein FXO38_12295 [Capsicum annuum]KAF3674596.1 hypothetical protein FXO37_06318 [Capsicum annuum]